MIVLSVVSPVHCEETGIVVFLDRLAQVITSLAVSFEVILVDDGSTDNSWRCIVTESRRRPWLRGLRLSRNFGKEAALAAGIEAARGQAVLTLDSDLQHPPEMIPEMFRLWREGRAAVVEAQKEKRQRESWIAGFFANTFYALFARLAPFDLKGASDFKLMDRRAVNAWISLGERRVFFRGMSSWLGFTRISLPFSPPERESGSSRWSFASKCILAVDSLSAYTASPLMLIWVLGFFFILFAVLLGGETLWAKFNGVAMTGFTTVILLILITGASLLCSVCLLSLYIRQIFHEVKGRPRYLVSESLEDQRPAMTAGVVRLQRVRTAVRRMRPKSGKKPRALRGALRGRART